jgi:hypothetical protein
VSLLSFRFQQSEELIVSVFFMDESIRSFHPAQVQLQTSSIYHLDLAKYWLETCLRTHGSCKSAQTAFIPSRLICFGNKDSAAPTHLSVSNDLASDTRYCALSHCWGNPNHVLKLTSENLDHLRNEITFLDLPKTYRDAITIARNLGQSYIWIDSLCIM